MSVRDAVNSYAKAIYACPDLASGVDLLSETAAALGFAGASCVFWPSSTPGSGELPPPAVQLSGANLGLAAAQWQNNYIKREMFKADFVYRACRRSVLPVVWSYDSLPEIVLGLGQRASMREIKGIEQLVEQTGFRGGISVPIHGPGGFFGYVAFTTRDRLPRVQALHEELGDALLGMALRFYDAVADKFATCTVDGTRLTARELECLSLLAMGKTLAETAEILHLSYSTIRFHLRNTEGKLGTVSRAHAIAKAAALGLLGRID